MIFIIGGNGLVGSAFARWCQSRSKPYLIVTRENYAQCIGKRCDILINANGSSSKILAQREPARDFDLAVRSVRRSLLDFKYQRYVQVSTCEVYPDCSRPEATAEDGVIDVARQSPYGFHRYLAERCVVHGASDWLIFRMGGLVGPGLRKNAIYDVMFGDRLWMDPDSSLQFITTDAAADIVLKLVEGSVSGEIFNVCGRGGIRLSEVIRLSGRQPAVTEGLPVLKYEVSTEKLRRLSEIPATADAVRAFVQEALGPDSKGIHSTGT